MNDSQKFAHALHRRIAEGIFLVSFAVISLFAVSYFSGGASSLSTALPVGDTAAMLAGFAMAVAAVAWIWTPKRFPAGPSLVAYTALWGTVAILIHTSGGASSPFVALWVMTAVFAGLYGTYGLLPLIVAPIGYLGWLYLQNELTLADAVTIIIAGELPLLLSSIAWLSHSSDANDPNRTYQQLASELSQVAGKAEVVINAITDGVIALNNQGNIQLINPAAQQLIGWGKHDALMLNYKSVLKLIDAKSVELAPSTDPVARALTTNQEVATSELSLITNSGKKVLISLVISPVGQPGSGVIIVFRDITKEKTEERQQAEFISTASHEMRTPVASIEGYLGLALNPATAQIDDKARDFITKAHEAAEHLGRLFQDLLDVSKAEDGRLSNKPTVVDVVAFTKDIVQGLLPKAEAKGLHMIFKPQPDEGEVEIASRRLNPVFYVNVDTDHLREVISNLVENAIKYTLKGTVIIDVGGDAEHVVISVEDSGIGIPAEDQPHLFQKFYRVDNSDTREIGGTGLGLYLCRRLAEAMDGRIWVESVYKQGSTFYVELPRISHEEAMELIEALNGSQEEKAIAPAAPPLIQAPAQTVAPPPQTAPVSSAEEAAFVNPSADTVSEQLRAAPQPATVNTTATTAPDVTPQTAASQPPSEAANPSLSAIEQNPNQYLRRPGSVATPPRNENQP